MQDFVDSPREDLSTLRSEWGAGKGQGGGTGVIK